MWRVTHQRDSILLLPCSTPMHFNDRYRYDKQLPVRSDVEATRRVSKPVDWHRLDILRYPIFAVPPAFPVLDEVQIRIRQVNKWKLRDFIEHAGRAAFLVGGLEASRAHARLGPVTEEIRGPWHARSCQPNLALPDMHMTIQKLPLPSARVQDDFARRTLPSTTLAVLADLPSGPGVRFRSGTGCWHVRGDCAVR